MVGSSMILPWMLFLLDIVSFAFFQQWLLFSLFCYYVFLLLQRRGEECFGQIWLSLALLLLQDFIRYDRFGLGLLSLLPILLIVFRYKYALLHAQSILFPLSVCIFFGMDYYVGNYLMQGDFHLLPVTIGKILINLAIGYAVLYGLQGNRSSLTIVRGGRKVWTPNRMDAS
jgi:hypothetical protein